MFVVAYLRETQEMIFDAHNRAFAFFGGVPQRMVYDNLKAVVETIFTGKERQFNRRFMVLANHYLFEPAGWSGSTSFSHQVFANSTNHDLPRLPRPQAIMPEAFRDSLKD